MPRSIQEIQADMARVQAAIDERNTLGTAMPEYRASRFDYVVDGDRSGLDAMLGRVAAAAESRRAREAQTKAAEIAREFQASEAQKARDFQAAENALNRADNRKVQDRNWYEEQARILRDLRNAHADYQASKQANVSEQDRARARHGLQYTLEVSKGAGIPEVWLKAYGLDDDQKTPGQDDPKTPPPVSDDFTVALNNALRDISNATTPSGVDSIISDISRKYGEDRSNTDKITELKNAGDKRKDYLKGKAKEAKLKGKAQEIANELKNRDKKRLVNDIRARYNEGNKDWLTEGEPDVIFAISPIGNNGRSWRLSGPGGVTLDITDE